MGRVAILTVAVALLVVSPPTRAQRDQDSPSDEEAMRIAEERGRAYVAAINAHDAAKATTFYAPEGERVVIDGIKVDRRAKGHAEIKEYYKRLFSANPQLRGKMTVESAQFVTPDVLTTGAIFEVTGFSGGSAQGRAFTVSRKQGERWLTVHDNMLRGPVQKD